MTSPKRAQELGQIILDLCTSKSAQHAEERILECIEQGADINIKNENGDTPVMLLLRQHQGLLARKLIEKGAHLHTINNNNENVLLVACRAGDRWSMEALYDTGDTFELNLRTTDSDKTTALHQCLRWDTGMAGRDFILTNTLFKFGTPDVQIKDACAWTPLAYVGECDSPHMYKKLIQMKKDAEARFIQSMQDVGTAKKPIQRKKAQFKNKKMAPK